MSQFVMCEEAITRLLSEMARKRRVMIGDEFFFSLLLACVSSLFIWFFLKFLVYDWENGDEFSLALTRH